MSRAAIIATACALSLVALAILRLVWPALNDWFRKALTADTTAPEPPPSSFLARWGWCLAGALFLILSLVLLETMQPCYFTQDDNLVADLPGMLVGCRSVWQGVFPDYCPNQFMGCPMAGSGGGSLTYPPTFLCYALARDVFHNEYLLVEVFAIFHLVLGYFATYWAGRSLGLRPPLAALGSLCFVLSGGILIMGRSWHMVTPVALWAPLLVVSLAYLERGPVGWKWMLGTALAVGLYYQVGFSQVWAYAMLFYGLALAMLVATGGLPWRRALWAVPALLLGLGLALPLLMQQVLITQDMERTGGYGAGIWTGRWALLFPYPLAQARHPNGWGSTDTEYMGQFYYSGTLFAALHFVVLAALVTSLPQRRVWGRNTWTVMALVALLMALGPDGPLWTLMSDLPLLDKINNNPFRALPFFVLFAALGGGLFLERVLQGTRWRRIWELGLALPVLALLLYHVTLARPSFYSYGDRPYPQMPQDMARLLDPKTPPGPERLLGMAQHRTVVPGYSLSMVHDLASVYGLYALDGYDPITVNRRSFREAMDLFFQNVLLGARAYGVRWLIFHQTCAHPVRSPNRFIRPMEDNIHYYEVGQSLVYFARIREVARLKFDPRVPEALRQHVSHPLPLTQPAHPLALALGKLDELFDVAGLVAKQRYSDGNVDIWEVPLVSPLAFERKAPQRGLPIRLNGAGADVDVSALAGGGAVVVNVLWYPELRAYADGAPVVSAKDKWWRVEVAVPPGTHTLTVRYEMPWGRGLAYGAGAAGVALLLAFLLWRWEKLNPPAQAAPAGPQYAPGRSAPGTTRRC